jgi:hypothetical protein
VAVLNVLRRFSYIFLKNKYEIIAAVLNRRKTLKCFKKNPNDKLGIYPILFPFFYIFFFQEI